MAVDHLNPAGTSNWHSVRPWTPRFMLTVREVTSVSATFILSSDLSSSSDPPLASLGLATADDDESFEDVPAVSDALGRGLSVNVNGATWKRVLVRMDDEGDEAIIILYGLMPGRQYDIELGIVSSEREEILHTRMVIQPQVQGATADVVSEESVPSSSDVVAATTTLCSRPISIEDYASQLRLKLNALNVERDALLSQVKSARKDSQKADATLRGEIDALRKAADKNATAEQRARQKVLALQEAVKQTLASTKDSEALAEEIEVSLPSLRERESDAEELHTQAKREEECSKAEANEATRADKKRTSELQNELTTVTNRLERLTGKRDKLLNESVPVLEERLAKLIREVELVERDAGAFEVIDNGPVAFDLGSRAVGSKGSKYVDSYGPLTTTDAPGSLLSSRAVPFEPVRAAQSQDVLRGPASMATLPARTLPKSSNPTAHSPTLTQGVDGNSSFEGPYAAYFTPMSSHQHNSLSSRSGIRLAPGNAVNVPPGLTHFAFQNTANHHSSYTFDPSHQHSHSHSLEYAQPVRNGSNSRFGLSALGPARQTSLPTEMPSSSVTTTGYTSPDQNSHIS